MGFKLNDELNSILKKHPLLSTAPEKLSMLQIIVKQTVLDRLVEELKVAELISLCLKSRVQRLLYQLKLGKPKIIDTKKFWNQMGFQLNSELLSMIKKHPLLCQQTESKQTILDRLIEELDVVELLNWYTICNSKLQIVDHGHDAEKYKLFDLSHWRIKKNTKYNCFDAWNDDKYFDEAEYTLIHVYGKHKHTTFRYKDRITILNNHKYKIQIKHIKLLGDSHVEFEICAVTPPSNKTQFVKNLFVSNENVIVVRETNIPVELHSEISKYRFLIVGTKDNLEEKNHAESFIFDTMENFRIPFSADTKHLFMQPLNAAFKYVEIKSFARVMFHISVNGAKGCGKSEFTKQFLPDYGVVLEGNVKYMELAGYRLHLDVSNTAGEEDFIALRTSWMREKHGFVLVFSVIERESFEELQSFYDQLCEFFEYDIPPFVLVGCKCELVYQQYKGGYKRQVTYEEAQNLARKWKAVGYFEISATSRYDVEEVFNCLLREMLGIEMLGMDEIQPQSSKKKKSRKKNCQIM
eukprot:371448_1